MIDFGEREQESGVIPTMQLTCYDGTVLEIADDNKAIHQLGATWHEIYTDSSKLSREAKRFITYRPPWTKRFIMCCKRKWAEVMS